MPQKSAKKSEQIETYVRKWHFYSFFGPQRVICGARKIHFDLMLFLSSFRWGISGGPLIMVLLPIASIVYIEKDLLFYDKGYYCFWTLGVLSQHRFEAHYCRYYGT